MRRGDRLLSGGSCSSASRWRTLDTALDTAVHKARTKLTTTVAGASPSRLLVGRARRLPVLAPVGLRPSPDVKFAFTGPRFSAPLDRSAHLHNTWDRVGRR